MTLDGFGPQLLLGAALTLSIWVGAAVVGTALGVVGALAKLRGGRIARKAAALYTTTVRGVPDLLLIFVAYFGGTVTLSWVLQRTIEVDAFTAGCVALGVIFGAYATEIFRGAILAVPKGQVEAAQAVGLREARTFTKVVLPQAWRLALPPYGNQLIVLLKQTSLVSIVGLEEIMRKANIGAGATNQPFKFYLAAAVLYLALTAGLSIALYGMERAAARGLARS